MFRYSAARDDIITAQRDRLIDIMIHVQRPPMVGSAGTRHSCLTKLYSIQPSVIPARKIPLVRYEGVYAVASISCSIRATIGTLSALGAFAKHRGK